MGRAFKCDSFAYVPSAYDTFWVLSVANPTQPRLLAGASIGDGGGYDVCLSDSYAFLGCRDFLHVFDISSPAQPVKVGYYETPWGASEVTHGNGLVYAACHLAGVCVFEMLPVGVTERRLDGQRRSWSGALVTPSPVRGHTRLSWSGSDRLDGITMRDAVGRVVWTLNQKPAEERRQLSLGLTRLRSGVYFVEVDMGTKTMSVKFVKQ
jgi:hypothetical protein